MDAVPEIVIPTVTLTVDWVEASRSGPAGYTIDGERAASIEIEAGTNYILDITALDGFEDYFQISSTPDGSHNGGTPISDDTIVHRDLGNDQVIIHATDNTPTCTTTTQTAAGAGGAVFDPVVLTVTAAGGKYFINDVEQAFIDLDPGRVYKFDVSDSSMSWHPLALSTTENGTRGGGVEYSDSDYMVGDDGTITLFVDDATPTLYYYCVNHSNMGGQASLDAPIVNVAPAFAAPTVTVTVDENDTAVYRASATDGDSDGLTYTLGGTDQAAFDI